MTLAVLFAVAAVVANIASFSLYVVDTVRGKIRPHRVSWATYFVIAAVAFGTQLSLSTGPAIFLAASQTAAVSLVFVLSLRRGTGGSSPLDLFCLSIALLAIVLWRIVGNPELGLIASVVAGAAASTPTILKSIKDPSSETPGSWMFGALGATFALLSITDITWTVLLYPAYLLIVDGIISWLLVRHRFRSVAAVPAES